MFIVSLWNLQIVTQLAIENIFLKTVLKQRQNKINFILNLKIKIFLRKKPNFHKFIFDATRIVDEKSRQRVRKREHQNPLLM